MAAVPLCRGKDGRHGRAPDVPVPDMRGAARPAQNPLPHPGVLSLCPYRAKRPHPVGRGRFGAALPTAARGRPLACGRLLPEGADRRLYAVHAPVPGVEPLDRPPDFAEASGGFLSAPDNFCSLVEPGEDCAGRGGCDVQR
ncbi:hypothetical protein GCM10022221_68180 [Actinocorallia aurea]